MSAVRIELLLSHVTWPSVFGVRPCNSGIRPFIATRSDRATEDDVSPLSRTRCIAVRAII